jgi:hypothetical protein
MKKLILVSALAIGLFSCQKEEVTPQPVTPVKNCNCDRIVNIVRAKYSFPGHQTTYFATITTVNDCSNWQKQYEYESYYSIYSKKEGDCY